MPRLLVCTRHGLVRLEGTGSTWELTTLLEGKAVRCVAAGRGRLLAGTRDGALLSTDDGASWHRADLPETDVYSVAIGAADGTLFAGTEPSRLFRSADGERWDELDALQSIPSRDQWSYPRVRGRPTCGGSRRIRTGPSACWSASSWAGSCTPTTAARASPTTARERSATCTRLPGTRASRAGPTRPLEAEPRGAATAA